MVKFRTFDVRQRVDAARQYLWRTESLAKLRLARSHRLAELESHEDAIKRALDAYRDLWKGNASVWLRNEFVALRTPRPLPPSLGGSEREEPVDRSTLLRDDYRTRPPCAKLLMRRTHALATYLTMIYVAQTEPAMTVSSETVGVRTQRRLTARNPGPFCAEDGRQISGLAGQECLAISMNSPTQSL